MSAEGDMAKVSLLTVAQGIKMKTVNFQAVMRALRCIKTRGLEIRIACFSFFLSNAHVASYYSVELRGLVLDPITEGVGGAGMVS